MSLTSTDVSLEGRSTRPRWYLPLSASLLAIGLGIRLLNLNGSLWLDEAGSLSQASASDFWLAARSDVHPPFTSFC